MYIFYSSFCRLRMLTILQLSYYLPSSFKRLVFHQNLFSISSRAYSYLCQSELLTFVYFFIAGVHVHPVSFVQHDLYREVSVGVAPGRVEASAEDHVSVSQPSTCFTYSNTPSLGHRGHLAAVTTFSTSSWNSGFCRIQRSSAKRPE